MSIFRTSALAATILISATACSEGGASDAQQTAGEEAAGGYLSNVSFDGDAGVQRGAADAPITMVEYASITCTHCKDFHDEVMASTVYDDYVATGKVKFIFREFPLNQIDVAGFAIARCAGEDDYFSVLHTFFDEQDSVISAAQDGTILDKLKDVGASYGLDESDVDACIEDSDIRRQIAASIDAGQADGVNSTPSIFINGTREETIESRSAEGMSNILDALLGNAPAEDSPEADETETPVSADETDGN
ncbi:MAG: thioredoxin domain-containing protein [Pseudomonadota bacterium]